MQKIIKRFFAVILMFVVCLSSQTLCAFAASDENQKMNIQVIPTEGSAGQTVQVSVNLQNNPGIASLKINVSYDEFLSLTSVQFNSAFGEYVTAPEPYKNPQALSMLSPTKDIFINGNFAVLTFRIADNAPNNYQADISLSFDEDDIFNCHFDNVDTAVKNGYVLINGNDTTPLTILAESVSGLPGELIKVNINLQNNPGIASLKIKVSYDEYLSLTSVQFNSAFGEYVTAPEPYKNPQALSMLSPTKDIFTNGNFAVLTFRIADNAPNDYQANISLSFDEDDIFNRNYQNVKTAVADGYVYIDKNTGLSPKDNTSIVIDDESEIIYGFDSELKNVNDFVKCKNCEAVLHPTSLGSGTGSTIDVIVKGKIEKIYTVVIFGDVDGDGKYDGKDSVIVNCITSGMLNKNQVSSAVYSAADCNHDGEINYADVELLQNAGLCISEISQIKTAKKGLLI